MPRKKFLPLMKHFREQQVFFECGAMNSVAQRSQVFVTHFCQVG